MSITIHDIAKIAGVNASTVSRALRNDPRVKEKTRERIHGIATQNNYILNLNAKNLINGKTGLIAFLTGSLMFDIEKDLAIYLNEFLAQHDYTLLILSYAPSPEKLFNKRLEKLTQKMCDGAIILGPNDDSLLDQRSYELIHLIKAPLIFADRRPQNITNLPLVTTDNPIAISGLLERTLEYEIDHVIDGYSSCNTVAIDRSLTLQRLAEKFHLPYFKNETLSKIPNNLKKAAIFVNNIADLEIFCINDSRNYVVAAFDKRGIDTYRYSAPLIICEQDFAAIARETGNYIIKNLNKQPMSIRDKILIPPKNFLIINQ